MEDPMYNDYLAVSVIKDVAELSSLIIRDHRMIDPDLLKDAMKVINDFQDKHEGKKYE